MNMYTERTFDEFLARYGSENNFI